MPPLTQWIEPSSAVVDLSTAAIGHGGLTFIVATPLSSRKLRATFPPSLLTRIPRTGSAFPMSSPRWQGDRTVEFRTVSVEDVDEYLRKLEEPKRSSLEAVRRTILEVIPEAEQIISYKVPAFRVDGRVVAGFAAFKDHLSYLPFSGSVLPKLAAELEGYTMTKSALHFSVDRPLPEALVKKLLVARLSEARST